MTVNSKAVVAILFILVQWAFSLSAAGAADFGIENGQVVVDQAGRRIVVKKPFSRIISLYGAHTENLFSLGAGDGLIGVAPNEDYPPEAGRKPVFSYHDDPEKFLAAKPDLVLTRPMIDRGYPQFVQRLEKSGITVVSLQPGTVEEMLVYWQILGILTGRREPAAAMAARFKAAVSELGALTASVSPKKRVYFEAIHAKMKTFAPDAMAVFALEAAGGVNVARDAAPVRDTNIAAYGKERILAHASEIDVFLAQSGTMNQPTLELIKAESGFHAIRAVKTNQVYIIDERLVSRPTMRLLDGIFEIGRILYPDDFTEKARDIITRAKQ
ncbi:MAG: ABC transporter substrate-binding protein [Deltaproteobacteria bacterium]|nr:ABC transporter substrate-binding protein [Deltaproteobacteria bacterium]